MSNHDEVLTALDAEIEVLERELQKTRELRAWWAARLPSRTQAVVGMDTEAEQGPFGEGRVRRPYRVGRTTHRATAKDFIVQALAEVPELTVPEIREAAKALGRQTDSAHPNTVIRNNLARLIESGQVEKDGTVYRLRPDPNLFTESAKPRSNTG